MSQNQPQIPGFRATFTIIGVIYILLASSMLVRGVSALRPFGVPDALVASPFMEDFFLFFYQFMAWGGVVMALFGQVTRGYASQMLVSGAYCAANLLIALRDLSTSDSRFGNRLYQGEATLVFVYISLTFAAAFAALLVIGLRKRHAIGSAS